MTLDPVSQNDPTGKRLNGWYNVKQNMPSAPYIKSHGKIKYKLEREVRNIISVTARWIRRKN
ncbi:unnamed protein product [Fusarium graminearum]|uniref:Chromosome 2, complete genome n=1 Tax=Gibberella zeae (strain ATCC MYA-4620 / CBS 123657 / FGSC 9075 / NRRL 31084 / PH-1) TaxID=229533 RepID=A0A098DIL1_GIBZE|nr:unnamed protein product [Fusarium graminearum]